MTCPTCNYVMTPIGCKVTDRPFTDPFLLLMSDDLGDTVRTQEYVVAECHSLCEQAAAVQEG